MKCYEIGTVVGSAEVGYGEPHRRDITVDLSLPEKNAAEKGEPSSWLSDCFATRFSIVPKITAQFATCSGSTGTVLPNWASKRS